MWKSPTSEEAMDNIAATSFTWRQDKDAAFFSFKDSSEKVKAYGKPAIYHFRL